MISRNLFSYYFMEGFMYQLNLLKYQYQDLEPFVDTKTVAVHYHKHHQTYLNNLNKLLNKNNYDYHYSLGELIYHIDEFKSDKEDILFNLGGVLNHNLYWRSINKELFLPTGKLKEEIDNIYGNFDNFWNSIKLSSLKLKGSGYTFLVLTDDGDLKIINTFNQDYPYDYIPLFNIDLWEHAYYLNYQNDKSRYIDNLKNIVDFRYASKIYNTMIMNY